MELKFLLLLIFIIILIVIVVRYIMKDVNTLSGVVSAKTMQTVSASSLASSSSGGNSSNYTYSVWFYVDDWNYRYGEPKVIFGRMTANNTEPCPSVSLGAIQNKRSNLVHVGVTFNDTTNFTIAIQEASLSDIIILTIGEETYTETPGNINNLFLNQEQYDLTEALFQTKKPVIVVYLGGRPRVITEIVNRNTIFTLFFSLV
jgi:hypothetical protein